MYAIIETGGKQYKVSNNDVIKVEKLDVKEGDSIVLDKVLAFNDDNQLFVGNPILSEKKVTATVLKQDKDKKVIVYKFKRKSGYHKKNGHRQLYTLLKVDSIS